jgi:hypothetical protein
LEENKASEDIEPTIRNPKNNVFHLNFLSSTALELDGVFRDGCFSGPEARVLAETVRTFILNPLRQIYARAETLNHPTLKHWETWSAEHDFDVQACYVLERYILTGCEITYKTPSGCSNKGYNSLSVSDKAKEIPYRLAIHDRALIESLTLDGISPHFQELLEKKFDGVNNEIMRQGYPPTSPAVIDLEFDTVTVAIIRYLEAGPEANFPSEGIIDDTYYIVKTDLVVQDPPTYGKA